MFGIIFDLDGTLIDSYDLDERLYRKAVLSMVPGVRFRNGWEEYRHSTDSGILMEILKEFNLSARDYYALIRRRFGELIKEHLQFPNNCKPIPGATNLIDRLQHNKNIEIGIATGGWGHTARMKLEVLGLSNVSLSLTSADDAYSRTEIMQICVSRFKSPITSYVYIGDGLWDLKAANELEWRFIGIGPRLKGKCGQWLPDFTNAALFDKLSRS